MSRFKPAAGIIVFLITWLGLALQPLAAAKLYKWIDEDGQIRYSDQLPPQQKMKRHQMLDPDGRIVETKEASKTPEQIRQERAEAQRLEEEARLEAEKQARVRAAQEHRDRVLLMTFTSESELLAAKEERISVVESVISLLRKNIEQEQATITRLEQRAQTVYIDKDKAVPGGLAQNIEYFNEKLLNKQRQLQLKIEERQRIKRQYAEDLDRYRQLTQVQQPQQ